jgi:hypothetical protein
MFAKKSQWFIGDLLTSFDNGKVLGVKIKRVGYIPVKYFFFFGLC